MLDSDSFSRNSPECYRLENTTVELLKFQLNEQSRRLQLPLQPLFLDASFDTHLEDAIAGKAILADEEIDGGNDEFSKQLGSSTPMLEVLESGNGHGATNQLNLRILIENSVFDSLKISTKSVLPLSRVARLKQEIADKTEHKEYLEERMEVLNQFCATAMLSGNFAEVDPELLLKIFRQNIDLQQQLRTITAELEALKSKLTNHNLSCLMLGYVEDVKLQGTGSGGTVQGQTHISLAAFDELFAHIVSLAAHANVSLPPYTDDSGDSLDSRIKWAQNCLDALFSGRPGSASTGATSVSTSRDPDDSVLQDHLFLSASPYAPNKDKVLSEYKVALDDLRFLHQYFLKEYDYLKENALSTILSYRKKNAELEKLLLQFKNGSSSSLSGEGSVTRDTLYSKDKEIARLRREIALLRVDQIGNKSPRNSAAANMALLSSPTDESDDNSRQFRSTYNQLASTSTALLRKEFKKILLDMQDQYEVELGEERLQRRQLEEKLAQRDVL